jgi:hypothetical protein
MHDRMTVGCVNANHVDALWLSAMSRPDEGALMPLTREDRIRNGRKGAYMRLAAAADWTAITEAARAKGPATLDWHANKVDPQGVLPPEQRYKMAEAARHAWYLNLAEKSRKARLARRAAQGIPPEAA